MKKITLEDLHFEIKLTLDCDETTDLEVHDLQCNEDYEVEDLPANIFQAIENEIHSWLEDLNFQVGLKLTKAWQGNKEITNDINFKKGGN